jgi:hypothetical protein
MRTEDEERRGTKKPAPGDLAVGSVGSTDPQDTDPDVGSIVRSDLGGVHVGAATEPGAGFGGTRGSGFGSESEVGGP